MSSDCGTPSAYEPPPSLWELVQRQVPVHEQTEVKGMLGESFVEQSLELHEEVSTVIKSILRYPFTCTQGSRTHWALGNAVHSIFVVRNILLYNNYF